MLELYQTEWCRGSQRVRQRLTELGIDFVARQVPEDPDDRDTLEAVAGARTVPVLVLEDGGVLDGTERILDHLDGLPERPDAAAHLAKARRSLRRACAELRSEECASTPSSPVRESPPAGVPTS